MDSDPNDTTTTFELERVDVRTLDRLLGADDVMLVNVMPPARFDRAHVPGSINIPLADGFEERVERATRGDHTRRVVVYGDDVESDAPAIAAGRLHAAGFERVIDFEGGTREWKDKGLPIETTITGRAKRVRRPRRLITHPALWAVAAGFGGFVIVVGFLGPAQATHWSVFALSGLLLVWAAVVLTHFIGRMAEEPTGEEGPAPDQPS